MKIAAAPIGTRKMTRTGILDKTMVTAATQIGIHRDRKAVTSAMSMVVLLATEVMTTTRQDAMVGIIKVNSTPEISATTVTITDQIIIQAWVPEAATARVTTEATMTSKATIQEVLMVAEVLRGIATGIFTTGTIRGYHGVAIRRVEHV